MLTRGMSKRRTHHGEYPARFTTPPAAQSESRTQANHADRSAIVCALDPVGEPTGVARACKVNVGQLE